MNHIAEQLKSFETWLREQEKSPNTIKKYLRDVKKFLLFAEGRPPERELLFLYKEQLLRQYQASSVNSMLIALNQYLRFIGKSDCRIKACRQQRQLFRDEERNLTKEEYLRLVQTARQTGRLRLYGILQTIAGTGIRIGELEFITAETLKSQSVRIHFKGKVRVILLPRALTIFLRDYCRKMRITHGSIFITRSGGPVDRRNIWTEMKALCKLARVPASKVFPHNLRHLFARCFYERERDLNRLADYLGHSSIETTRRYTMITSREACEGQLRLGLILGEQRAGDSVS